MGYEYEIPINIGNAVYEGEARFKQSFPRQHLALVFAYGLNVAYPYSLGPNVSNPTSGGSLVDDEQFLGVPQQQGSATMMWAEKGWHAATQFTFAGRNNPLNQPPYTLIDAAVGKNFGRIDFTVAATNIFNSVSGPFTLYGGGVPYRGLSPGPEAARIWRTCRPINSTCCRRRFSSSSRSTNSRFYTRLEFFINAVCAPAVTSRDACFV